MTKHHLFALLFVTLLATSAIGQSYDYCDTKTLKDSCKDYLDHPYKYDASNIILVTLQRKPQLKELEIPLFLGESYRLIFNTYALPPGIEIHVYNKDADHDNRKELFSCNSSGAKRMFIYEPEHVHSKLYIDYVIPAAHDNSGGTDAPVVQGCGVLVIGYK
ncbi:MAG TPA: hypothetical protein VK890_10090 [Bacteroidia bacterium]|jgi:hypothetical protein|nr:hypothetical protein [Bacteroidia bacterium]